MIDAIESHFTVDMQHRCYRIYKNNAVIQGVQKLLSLSPGGVRALEDALHVWCCHFTIPKPSFMFVDVLESALSLVFKTSFWDCD